MNGSEKQIKWARDILNRVYMICANGAVTEPANAESWLSLCKKIDNYHGKASNVISAFEGIRFSGDPVEDFNKIVHRTSAREFLASL